LKEESFRLHFTFAGWSAILGYVTISGAYNPDIMKRGT